MEICKNQNSPKIFVIVIVTDFKIGLIKTASADFVQYGEVVFSAHFTF